MAPAKLLEGYLARMGAIIDSALASLLPSPANCPEQLCQAMSYSLLAGGKRLRPVLTLAAAEAVGGAWEQALTAACAVEMVHTYSLIHDDLPAMDDDDWRRGKPTSHRVFGEAMAILAGDALLTHAFELLGQIELPGAVRLVAELAGAAGAAGMVGGQVMDLAAEGQDNDLQAIAAIHQRKTGALFRAAVRMGALAGGASERQLQALTSYAEKLGLAFQIVDDLLDVEGDPALTGKDVGSDTRKQKATYPSLIGLEPARQLAAETLEQAERALDPLGDAGQVLKGIARYLVNRQR